MKFPDMDQKSFRASPASENSREVGQATLLILQENQGDPLLELVAAVSRWMFSGLDLIKGVDSSICDWKYKFSFFFGKYNLFRIESF